MGTLKNKIKNSCKSKYMIIAASVLVVLIVILIMSFGKGDGAVEFRVLTDAEIPQAISSEVIPEYRGLERALACVVDDKIYVVVTRGEKPTSGYEIAIAGMDIEKENGLENLVVNADFKDPEPGGSLSQVLTYPLQIAETNLTELPDSIELRVKY